MKHFLKRAKTILFFSIVLVTRTMTYAQSYTSTIDAGIGLTDGGYAVLVGFNYYINQHDFLQGSVYGSSAKDKYKEDIKIPYNDLTVNIGFFKNFYYNRTNTLKINIGAGGLFGYESINSGKKNLPNGGLIDNKCKFVYGAFAGIDIDILLRDDYSLTLKANEYYHANSSIGYFTPYVGVGIRYFLK